MAAAREMYGRAGWTIAFALVIYYINHREYPGPALTLTLVLVLIGLVFGALGYGLAWLSGPGRQRVLDQVLDSLQIQGSEKVLDAGSPGGQLGLGVARRLTSGRVVALGDTDANAVPRDLAKNEGLGDRIRFEAADYCKLSYSDSSFDCVTGSQWMDSLGTDHQRLQALRELVRVVKPGGRISLHEIGSAADLARLLPQLSLTSASVESTDLPLRLGGRIVCAQKPSLQQ